MDQASPNTLPQYFSESSTVTVIGVRNMGTDLLSAQSVTSFSIPAEYTERSQPLSDLTVRIGDSLLHARVPEDRIRRDDAEEF